jgi:hypothetical protein
MSIYRTLKRLPLSDVHHVAEHVSGPDTIERNGAAILLGKDWAARRKGSPAETLLPATIRWMVALPIEMQPRALSKAFPRIANMLARLWRDPSALTDYMDDLLVDRRGGRKGFPVDVLADLQTLRDYCGTLSPDKAVIWDELSQAR